MNHRSLVLLLALSTFTPACGSDDDTQTQTQIPVPDLTTIAEARKLPSGKLAKIEGFVTVEPGTFTSSTGDVGFALQDATGGIYVNIYDFVDVKLNNKVLLLGQIIEANGLKAISTNSTGIDPKFEISPVAPEDVKTGDIGESTEGKLVRVKGKVTTAPIEDKDTSTGAVYGFKAFVDDGSGELQVYINLNTKKEPLIDTTKLVPDAMVEITGLSSQFNQTYEITPRKAIDLVVP